MKRLTLLLASLLCMGTMFAQSIVFITKDISPDGLMKAYKALGVELKGNVAVKISTGEGEGKNALKPNLIAPLVKSVHGTIVECNTAYPGNRVKSEDHWKAIKEHGYLDIAPVDIMDEEGEMKIPTRDKKHISYDIVGTHLQKYNSMINLAHFKGHQMAGFGGVLKNQSIGVASSNGKTNIHTAGKAQKMSELWDNLPEQDAFLESMAAAAQAVADYFKGEVVYIAVMNNMSIDCDCNAHPANPEIKDYGILASTDPVALDQACLDIIFNMKPEKGNDPRALIERINKQHGTHITEYAEKIGFGSRKYKLVSNAITIQC